MSHSTRRRSHTLFIVSDRTGITLEQLVRTLTSQFDGLCCEIVVRPFVDTEARVDSLKREIRSAADADAAQPMVFVSIVDEALRTRLKASSAKIFDIFDTFLPAMSKTVGIAHSRHIGRSHGMGDVEHYDRRVDAVSFALSYDDGSRFKGLSDADLILVGVSRSGKTPTCLYLAMQYTVQAANFPLTEDDFMLGKLPEPLHPHRDRLFGLTIAPDRLHRIREERRPGSSYASLPTCREEVAAAEGLFRASAIPFLDATTVSIEELAVEIMQRVGVGRTF